MRDIASLIERLENATGPDRELEGEIAATISAHPKGWRRGAREAAATAYWFDDRLGDIWSSPGYTSSIDAALTLVPEGWFVDRMGESRSRIVYKNDLHDPEGFYAEAQDVKGGRLSRAHSNGNLAIAICIAALRARTQCEPEKQP